MLVVQRKERCVHIEPEFVRQTFQQVMEVTVPVVRPRSNGAGSDRNLIVGDYQQVIHFELGPEPRARCTGTVGAVEGEGPRFEFLE